mmetsp:Transcript_12602/g.29588  ORF Transcript_12602/g.29588 Transcript_12602/m.29588 type:complete len:363 (+) Transcript_12602:71-1159(+)|eukprot:CAMPEP_0171104644 /NCGR_PEP_ID=MMETSP0766_2-20121228/61056_1 /TAXON_ID=439317 /ORGANISM="Gambierdiscus australes, Strain CAWD 149" /LENGTH=362 /DNA_ID=CAMNT_0011565303 /DNA_START=64 /DNA_END=1152 /DNA_ORIENTATION=+
MELPPNWKRYVSPEGKEYFHNATLGLTQWDPPVGASGLTDSLSFHSGTSEVYEYKPTVSDLELHQRFSDAEGGKLVGMRSDSQMGPVEAAGKAPGGKIPTTECETVSFSPAPASGGTAASSSEGFVNFSGGSSLMGGVLAAATAMSADDGAGISGIAGSALTYAQQLFDVSSEDVIKRLRLALVPYPPQPNGSANEFRARPDFWGPFWIATTAVLFLAATGNFARLVATEADFKADYGLVSVAASMIYGFLVGVPLVTRVALYCSGHEAGTINFRQMICVYGYSLAPTIPVSILCLVPLDGMRWLAVLVGLGVSLFFIRENLLTDIAVEAPSLKWKMVVMFCVSQACIFGVYRVHFFSATSA